MPMNYTNMHKMFAISMRVADTAGTQQQTRPEVV